MAKLATATRLIARVCVAANATSTGCGPKASRTGPTPKTPSGCARPKSITFTVITLGRSAAGTRSVMSEWIDGLTRPFARPERPSAAAASHGSG